MIIAPSLLSADFLNLKQDIARFDGIENLWLHLDIMDGHFVPNLTFGAGVLKELSSITNHKLDAHLMVTNPEEYIQPLSKIGIYNYTFHWEAVTHHDSLIAKARDHFKSVGVALNPSTPVHVIPSYLLAKLDLNLIMSVNPGFGGQSFIEGTIDKILKLTQLKNDLGLSFQIQVDGGINDNNVKRLKDAGANNVVAGSYIFNEKNNDYSSQITKLREA